MDVSSDQLSSWKKYRRVIRRNFVSVFFPVVVTSAILFDWTKTRRFKRRKAEFEQSLASSKMPKFVMKGSYWGALASLSIPVLAYLAGRKLQQQINEDCDRFRNKSQLYGGRKESVW